MTAVVVGGAAEEDDAKSIIAAIPTGKCINLTGRVGLIELQDIIRDSRLFVGNNSGPTHMAARLGIPTVCVFSGRADPKIWRPRGPYVRVVQARQPCAPCHLSDESQCNFGKACTRDITMKMVMRACETVLKRNRAAVSRQRDWWRFGRR
jgi:ADP-heptose:LPS heptosyltransferase